MDYVFAGTDEFAVKLINQFSEAYRPPGLVLTQKPKPRGRGLKVKPTPVAEWARSKGIPVIEIGSFNEIREKEVFKGFKLLLVCSFGLYIPEWFTRSFEYTLNFHPSLVPEYRGAAPIRRALMDGKNKTGVSLIEVSREMDAGRVYASKEVEIKPDDNYRTLSDRLIIEGLSLLLDTVKKIETGKIKLEEQKGSPTYAGKISKDELWIDWSRPASAVHNQIRALSPDPGARTVFRGRQLKILAARPVEGVNGKPGEVLGISRESILVACGKDGLEILKVQPENSRVISASEFVNGYRPQAGEMFQQKS